MRYKLFWHIEVGKMGNPQELKTHTTNNVMKKVRYMIIMLLMLAVFAFSAAIAFAKSDSNENSSNTSDNRYLNNFSSNITEHETTEIRNINGNLTYVEENPKNNNTNYTFETGSHDDNDRRRWDFSHGYGVSQNRTLLNHILSNASQSQRRNTKNNSYKLYNITEYNTSDDNDDLNNTGDYSTENDTDNSVNITENIISENHTSKNKKGEHLSYEQFMLDAVNTTENIKTGITDNTGVDNSSHIKKDITETTSSKNQSEFFLDKIWKWFTGHNLG